MFETKDLELATVLRTLDIKLLNYEKRGKEIWFTFEKEEECKRINIAFFNGEVEVNPRKMFNCWSDLKAIISNLIY